MLIQLVAHEVSRGSYCRRPNPVHPPERVSFYPRCQDIYARLASFHAWLDYPSKRHYGGASRSLQQRVAASSTTSSQLPPRVDGFYSSQPPQKNNDHDPKKPEDPKEAEKNKEGKEESESPDLNNETKPKPEKELVVNFQMREGWVLLTKEELKHVEAFKQVLPPPQQEVLAEIIEKLPKTGVPPEARELLQKIGREGTANLSIMEKGKLMRFVFQAIEEFARYESAVQEAEMAQGRTSEGKDGKAEQHGQETNEEGQKKGQEEAPTGQIGSKELFEAVQSIAVLLAIWWVFG